MQKLTVGLVGNPNCGKTTLFNALTKSKQRVGNWPGVTVEKKTGVFQYHGQEVCVVDLPGTYNLTVISAEVSLDEKIACDYILSQEADVFVNIIDASNLERNLYLSTQLLEMGIPLIIALNMMDVARQRGLFIDHEQLSRRLNCPVVLLEANKNKGVKELKAQIIEYTKQGHAHAQSPQYPEAIRVAQTRLGTKIEAIRPDLSAQAPWLALRLLEDDVYARTQLGNAISPDLDAEQENLRQALGDDPDIFIADGRYSFVNQLTRSLVSKDTLHRKSLTGRIDKVVLHRFYAIPVFLLIMYSMFLFAINIGGVFQNFFDISSDTIFVQGLSQLLASWGVPAWFIAIIASGLGKGINTTITFIPIIGAMFLFLAFLEDSGYMARAAFVVDRFMRAIGLPGKSFVPLIVGFGCNVPAIMAARTLENKRDRVLTVLMSPFMSCGARLAIFAVFTAAFFPRGGQNIVFALYLIGILMAMLTGLILRKTLLQGDPSPLVMELPPYHLPKFSMLLRHAWQRLKNFLWKAGRLIIPICILIGALNAFNIDGSLNLHEASENSLLSFLGQYLTPIFAPLGIHANNWPATVGLLTGVLAKEVVIATLNTLYTQVGHLTQFTQDFNFWAGIQAALQSVPDNIRNLSAAFSNPVLASAPDYAVNQGVFGIMYQRFDGQTGAFAYLLFVLLYIPCISSTAAMARELGRYWTLFSLFWNTMLAYGTAVLFYQSATLTRHPVSSIAWILGILIFWALTFLCLRFYAVREHKTSGFDKRQALEAHS